MGAIREFLREIVGNTPPKAKRELELRQKEQVVRFNTLSHTSRRIELEMKELVQEMLSEEQGHDERG